MLKHIDVDQIDLCREKRNTHHYISSKVADAATFNQNIRDHWGIENKVQCVIIVTFGKDKSRKRKGNSTKSSYLTAIIVIAPITYHQR